MDRQKTGPRWASLPFGLPPPLPGSHLQETLCPCHQLDPNSSDLCRALEKQPPGRPGRPREVLRCRGRRASDAPGWGLFYTGRLLGGHTLPLLQMWKLRLTGLSNLLRETH